MSNRKKRANLAQETLNTLEAGSYVNAQKEVVDIQEALDVAIEGTELYAPEDFKKEVYSERDTVMQAQSFDTVFEVTAETTLQAARRLVEEGHQDIAVLNFASAKNPGGGFLGGSQAQEESLARSSALYPCLEKHKSLYLANRKRRTGLYSDHMIYAPQVPVFRDDDGSFLDTPYPISIITSPAVNAGSVKDNYPHELDLIENTMLERTEKVLSLAVSYQHRVLVLGAWGCGVFKNNPKDIARYFATFLQADGRFAQVFEKVVFAVYSGQKVNPNLPVFEELFG
ncbi:MAG TPA: TIGR02452 family protein [Microscillaceae bacterium]|nr:TIGR02452 family protein [Microscillaceae bacterium]